MNIKDVHIEQKLYDTEMHSTFIVTEIYANGKLCDTYGTVHTIENIEPIKNSPYTETDNYGNISLCVNTPTGKLIADIDNPADYTTMYLSIQPTHADETIDLASARINSNKDITICTFDDCSTENANHKFIIPYNDIKEALDIKEES